MHNRRVILLALKGAAALAAALLLQACAGTPPARTNTPQAPPALDAGRIIRQSQVAYAVGDYRRAAGLLRPLAEKGNPAAQYALGYLYFYGDGVPRDPDRAMALIRLAAGQGYAKARKALALNSTAGTAGTPGKAGNGANRPSAPLSSGDGKAKQAPAAASPGSRAPQMPGAPQARSLAAQNPQDAPFTIQLISSHSRGSALGYLKRHHIQDKADYFSFRRDGHTWFAVGYGRYATHRQAEAALAQLAPALRTYGPWIRRLGDMRTIAEHHGRAGHGNGGGVKSASTGKPVAGLPTAQAMALGSVPPAALFTIQLVSSHQAQEVRAYIARHGIGDRATAFSYRRGGRRWFAVIYGRYAGRARAERALRKLPAAVRRNGPWIRRLADIRKLSGYEHAPPAADPGKDKSAGASGRFTIQLVGSSDEGGVKAYIRSHGISGRATYVSARRDGGHWYAVVYGDYATRRQAEEALRGLPAALRVNGPWIRRRPGPGRAM